MKSVEDERQEERRRASKFFKGSGKVPPAPSAAVRRRLQRRVSATPSTSVTREAVLARSDALRRFLLVLLVLACLATLVGWWLANQPRPVLESATFNNSPQGCVINFTVTNVGGPGTIQMTPKLVLSTGREIAAEPMPDSVSYFERGQTRRLQATIGLAATEQPQSCFIKCKRVLRLLPF